MRLIGAGPRRRLRAWLGPPSLDESDVAYAALRGRRGVMLDIGAHHGGSLARFADDGWSVHAFEPDPANRARLESAFGGRPNVTINPVAVSDVCGEMPLFTSELSTGISSLAAFTDAHVPTATVPVITLRSYLASAGIAAVDFMKVDVEGFERNVLRGYDWSVRPEVVVLEFEDAKTLALGYSWRELAKELVRHDYDVVVSEWYPIERYGGAHRWRRAARYPTELADPAGWGNLVAVSSATQLARAERAIARYGRRRRIEGLVRPRRAAR